MKLFSIPATYPDEYDQPVKMVFHYGIYPRRYQKTLHTTVCSDWREWEMRELLKAIFAVKVRPTHPGSRLYSINVYELDTEEEWIFE